MLEGFLAGLLGFDRLLPDKRGCVRGSLQSIDWDGLAGDFTDSIGSVFNTLERPLYLRQFLPSSSIFIDVGFSKFVVRPLTTPPSWRAEIEALSAAVGDLQT